MSPFVFLFVVIFRRSLFLCHFSVNFFVYSIEREKEAHRTHILGSSWELYIYIYIYCFCFCHYFYLGVPKKNHKSGGVFALPSCSVVLFET
ncbi:putative protein kinase [Trypanosoma cruzi Dm28c]|uniref:Uncharacterized protein n=1 Tax=Trypanosoma cruzi Dm28c TaxID=1416333 RepID=V5DP72_TRYCR|nr:putative protein kinase [Trypanosoma cruzi Dm28c]